MSENNSLSWLYYKILLGNYTWAFDRLISMLSEILKNPEIKKWFFIRYIDQDGIHLRLRLGVDSSASETLDRRLYSQIHAITAQLNSIPKEEDFRLVKIGAPTVINRSMLGVKRDEYKPEIDIYGGKDGVYIAEDVFHVSSDIALRVIEQEENGISFRKDLAPALMQAALDEVRIQQPRLEFVDNYINYWSAVNPAYGFYVATFEEKAKELIDTGYPIVRKDEDYGVASEFLNDWRQSLRKSMTKYRTIDGHSDVLITRVLFYFIHLMNNRFGFTILEEIYLAVLLRQSLLLKQDTKVRIEQ